MSRENIWNERVEAWAKNERAQQELEGKLLPFFVAFFFSILFYLFIILFLFFFLLFEKKKMSRESAWKKWAKARAKMKGQTRTWT
jgi:predicted PurR-regulated permease PerM